MTCHRAAGPCHKAPGERLPDHPIYGLPPGDYICSSWPSSIPTGAQAPGRITGLPPLPPGEVTTGGHAPQPPLHLTVPCPPYYLLYALNFYNMLPYLRSLSAYHQLNSLIPTGDKWVFHCNLLLIQTKTGLGRGKVEVRKWEGSQPTLPPPGSSGSCGSEGILDQNPWAHQPMLEQHTCDWDLANPS